MKRAFLILLIVIGVGIGVLLLSRDKAELFANGNLVCPAPFGDLVAIQEKPNVWLKNSQLKYKTWEKGLLRLC